MYYCSCCTSPTIDINDTKQGKINSQYTAYYWQYYLCYWVWVYYTRCHVVCVQKCCSYRGDDVRQHKYDSNIRDIWDAHSVGEFGMLQKFGTAVLVWNTRPAFYFRLDEGKPTGIDHTNTLWVGPLHLNESIGQGWDFYSFGSCPSPVLCTVLIVHQQGLQSFVSSLASHTRPRSRTNNFEPNG